MTPLQLYDNETAKLNAIAEREFTGRRHLCENLKEYPPHIQDEVCKILRKQVLLLIEVNRQYPLPYYNGK